MSCRVQTPARFASKQELTSWVVLSVLILLPLATHVGCQHGKAVVFDQNPVAIQPFAQQIEVPQVCDDNLPDVDLLDTPAPVDIQNERSQDQKWPMTLEEAIQTALANSEVIRTSGGLAVTSPFGVSTVYDAAIAETNPLNGPEAALSQFDAQFATSLYFNRDERSFNNFFIGGGASSLSSNTSRFTAEVTKIAPTGTTFAMRHQVDYNRNNSPVNSFRSIYDSFVQGEFRHPLMFDMDFYRIAGANPFPGQYNGILVSRINTDVELADFEIAIRDLVRSVELTYWELVFAYRDLDSKVRGRDANQEAWRISNDRVKGGIDNPTDEAVARATYYASQADVENALAGRANGSAGVYAVERQLRRLLGLPVTDGRIIVPTTEPSMTEVRFEWTPSVAQALVRRAEVRRQQWVIKQRELQLIAARYWRRPDIDFFGQYTWRGFGDDLFGDGPPNQSTYQSLLDGDLSGWRMGLELRTPIGNRIGYLATRNAELNLSREKALLKEQERVIVSGLRAGYHEIQRAYNVTRTNYNRYKAALSDRDKNKQRYDAGAERLDFYLAARGRLVIAESAFHRSLIDYNIALLEFEYARGTLLDHQHVFLSEGPWVAQAHQSAENVARRLRYKKINYCIDDSYLISNGEYPQRMADMGPAFNPEGASGVIQNENQSGPPAPPMPQQVPPGQTPSPSDQRAPVPDNSSVIPDLPRYEPTPQFYNTVDKAQQTLDNGPIAEVPSSSSPVYKIR